MNRRLFLMIIPFMIFSSAIGGAEYDLQSILKLAESRNKEIKLAAADLKRIFLYHYGFFRKAPHDPVSVYF